MYFIEVYPQMNSPRGWIVTIFAFSHSHSHFSTFCFEMGLKLAAQSSLFTFSLSPLSELLWIVSTQLNATRTTHSSHCNLHISCCSMQLSQHNYFPTGMALDSRGICRPTWRLCFPTREWMSWRGEQQISSTQDLKVFYIYFS